MIYKCIEDFEIPVINENGMMTESILKITSGMFFKEIEDNALSGAEIKLESIFDDTFIEISKETLKSLFKDIEFIDLLEMQKQLDKEVAKPRDNGFVPRERTTLDIRLALDDEFQEWLRELPKEYNFKTWKQKEYNRGKELEELVDCLFFFLQMFNYTKYARKYLTDKQFDNFRKDNERTGLQSCVISFKENLWNCEWTDGEYDIAFLDWIDICKLRGFSKEEIIQTYLNKWKKNMQRIKGDWSNEV